MKIREDIITQQKEPDKLIGIAAILQSIPLPFVYWCLTLGTFGIAFILWVFSAYLALMAKVVFWLGVSALASRIGLFAYSKVHFVRRNNAQTRAIEEQSYQETIASQKMLIANETALAKLAMYRQLPPLASYAMDNGLNVKYGGLEVTSWKSHIASIQAGTQVEQIEGPISPLPTNVRYEDIRHQIPEGHNLVGIGPDGLITKDDRKIGACVWIVGLSGTGKTSTTSLRVEERASCGHKFLGVDPHWFKDDSLTNAIVGYADLFLKPIARNTSETLDVLRTFENEFQARKAGKIEKPFQKITLIVDEVGALADAQTKEEKEVLDLLQHISRVCGQEARNFNMGGIFISQQATKLAWLRKVALLIIVHKLLMESEQILATNCNDKAFLAEMRVWPIGRTYVFGTGLESGEGCITVQQPAFAKEATGHVWVYPDIPETTSEESVSDLDLVYYACMQLKEQGKEVSSRVVAPLVRMGKTKVAELMSTLERQGCVIR